MTSYAPSSPVRPDAPPAWVGQIRQSISSRNAVECTMFKRIVNGYSRLQTDYNDAILHIVELSRECIRLRTLITSGATSSEAASIIAADEAAISDPSSSTSASPLAAAFAFAASRPRAWLGLQGLTNLIFSAKDAESTGESPAQNSAGPATAVPGSPGSPSGGQAAVGASPLASSSSSSAASSSSASAAAPAGTPSSSSSFAPPTGLATTFSASEMQCLASRLAADSARHVRDLDMADRRLAHTDALLVAREGALASLRGERDALQKDAEVRRSYIAALEQKLSFARRDAEEWQEQTQRLQRAEAEAARAREELMALRASIALGSDGSDGGGSGSSAMGSWGGGGSGGEKTLRFSADDLQRSTVAWGVKTRPVPPKSVRLYREAHRSAPITACRYHCDGAVLVTAGADGAVKFHQARSGKAGLAVIASQQPLTCLAVSPDHATIAFGGADKRAYLWNTFTKQAPRTWPLSGEVVGLGFLSADRLITAAKSRTDCFRIIDLASTNANPLAATNAGAGTGGVVADSAPVALAVASHSGRFATAHLDKSIRIWSAAASAASSSSGSIFGSGDDDDGGSILAVGVVEDVHAQRITSLEFDSTQNLLLSNSWDGTLQIRDMRQPLGDPVLTLSQLMAPGPPSTPPVAYVNRQEMTRAAFSPGPDARYIVAGDNLGRVAFWDLRNAERAASVVATPSYNPRAPPPAAGAALTPAVTCVDWNPNGRQVAAVNRMGCLALLEDEPEAAAEASPAPRSSFG